MKNKFYLNVIYLMMNLYFIFTKADFENKINESYLKNIKNYYRRWIGNRRRKKRESSYLANYNNEDKIRGLNSKNLIFNKLPKNNEGY